jgi:hypothetical protein
MFNGDIHQLTAAMQTYLIHSQKFGHHAIHPHDVINPWLCLQLIDANNIVMQQLAAMQSNVTPGSSPTARSGISTTNDACQPSNLSSFMSHVNSSTESQIPLTKYSHVLHANSNIFVPQTRPMNPNEIAEHARVVYQRAIQRNQLQHQNDLMKHFHESLSCAQQKDQSPSNVHSVDHCQTAIDHVQVPSVPNVSHIGRMKIYH